jgi:hypothetical protein
LPIISKLIMATSLSAGIGRFSARCLEPMSPFSSAVKVAKTRDRRLTPVSAK